jgi:tRNA threonylcarbamoyladenosine biosynthesis protein TsaB
MGYLLAIEASTQICSVALLKKQEVAILYKETTQQEKPSQSILKMIDSLLAEASITRAQLESIGFGCGPGNFTGVRLATSVAQALAFALDIPLLPISTLRCLAQQAWRIYQYPYVFVALDARLQQIYSGCFALDKKHIMQAISAEILCKPTGLADSFFKTLMCPADQSQKWAGIGSGWDCYQTSLNTQLTTLVNNLQGINHCYPQAYDIACLALADYQQGKQRQVLEITPIYLREDIARC